MQLFHCAAAGSFDRANFDIELRGNGGLRPAGHETLDNLALQHRQSEETVAHGGKRLAGSRRILRHDEETPDGLGELLWRNAAWENFRDSELYRARHHLWIALFRKDYCRKR